MMQTEMQSMSATMSPEHRSMKASHSPMDEDVKASMHKDRKTTLERMEKYITHNQFHDVNLWDKLYPNSKQIDRIAHWRVPGGAGSWEQWSFRQMATQDFRSAKIGETFGPLWSTHWFRLEVNIPESWKGQQVWLRWNSQAEAMLWSMNGEPLQSFSPGYQYKNQQQKIKKRDSSSSSNGFQNGNSHEVMEVDNDYYCDDYRNYETENNVYRYSRTEYPISRNWSGSQDAQVFYIEMACTNTYCADKERMKWGNKDRMFNNPEKDRTFKLDVAEVYTMNGDIYKLKMDLEVLYDMARSIPKDDTRGYDALYTGNQVVNYMTKNDYRMASKVANNFFSKGNGARAHTLAMIGNCHIDSAWLWPYSESKRKCARSWISTLNIMEEYPEMRFACSQAQQFSWIKSQYPQIFEKIRSHVKAGRFIPVGGSWVEMDGQMPSGESLMRQFLYGQLFYQREFGVQCKEFWLPDTFSYSPQFPQICKQFGITRFLTQNMNWNKKDKFPHHNFVWEGIDGTSMLTHFVPGNSCEMNVQVDEAWRTVRNLKDKGRVSVSAFMYGHGNSGGGPTRDMMERARRMKDVDGCPRMEHMSPNSFFKRLESEKQNMCRWFGELNTDVHTGIYTSQANTKRQNRMCEFALRDAEMMLAVASMKGELNEAKLHAYQEALVGSWKKLLLNQFNYVLPGNSINMVYRDSDQTYQEALALANQVKEACSALILQDTPENMQGDMVVVNTFPWKVQQVVAVNDEGQEPARKRIRTEGEVTQPTRSGGYYMAVEAPGIGWTKMTPMCPAPVAVRVSNGQYILENSFLRAEINKHGQVTSLTCPSDPTHDVFKKREGQREAQQHRDGMRDLPFNGNQLMMYDDIPLHWDSWDTMDYHLETAKVLNDDSSNCTMSEMKVIESGPLMVKLQWEMKISSTSSMTQEIELSACSPYLTFNTNVNWNENRKFLKVGFNTGFNTNSATYDSQFGYVQRPTHGNTPYDSAKFEVCGHKWADLSEYDFGMSVLNDSKYGWSARGSKMSLSLLRSPKSPDDRCDRGTHKFRYALMPHKGSFQNAGVQRRAYEFNNELMVTSSTLSEDKEIWYSLVGEGAMIETVKMAEDKTGDVIVRLYEMEGGSPKVWLKVPSTPRPRSAYLCSGLEGPYKELSFSVEETNKYLFLALNLTPFKVTNVRISYG